MRPRPDRIPTTTGCSSWPTERWRAPRSGRCASTSTTVPRCRSVLDGIAEVRSAVRRVPPEPAPERGLESLLAYGELAAARARAAAAERALAGLVTLATAALAGLRAPPPHPAPGEASEVARVELPTTPADR